MKTFNLRDCKLILKENERGATIAYAENNGVTIRLGEIEEFQGYIEMALSGEMQCEEDKETIFTDEDNEYNELEERGLNNYKNY